MIILRHFEDHVSTYNKLEQIPNRFRLSNFTQEFNEKDIWGEFFQDQYPDRYLGDKPSRPIELAKDSWKTHCERNGRHHALASPATVDTWCNQLLDRMKKRSAKSGYIRFVNHFYRFLKWNIEYPHVYNPVQFAVKNHDTTGMVWNSDPRRD